MSLRWYFFLFLLFLPVVLGEIPAVEVSSTSSVGGTFTGVVVYYVNNTNHSNSTDYWVTGDGVLATAGDIHTSWLNNDANWITNAQETDQIWLADRPNYINQTHLTQELLAMQNLSIASIVSSLDLWNVSFLDINNSIDIKLQNQNNLSISQIVSFINNSLNWSQDRPNYINQTHLTQELLAMQNLTLAQAEAAWNRNYTAFNGSWSSTFNVTYAAGTNASWNETRANELYVPYGNATGNVNLSFYNISLGAINASPDEDVINTFGRAKIGGITNNAVFSHYHFFDVNNFALLQDNGGTTYLNAPTGQIVYLSTNGVGKARLSGTDFSLNYLTLLFGQFGSEDIEINRSRSRTLVVESAYGDVVFNVSGNVTANNFIGSGSYLTGILNDSDISTMVNANATFLALMATTSINPNISSMVNANTTFLSIADQNVNPNISTMVNANSSFLNLFNVNPNISTMVNANATFLSLVVQNVNPNISAMVNANSTFLSIADQNVNPNISAMVNANSSFLSIMESKLNNNGNWSADKGNYSSFSGITVCTSTSNFSKNRQCDLTCSDSDCTAKIQSAIDSAYANNFSIIQLGDGTFNINSPIIKKGNGIKLLGTGIDKTILKLNATAMAAFSFNYIIGYSGSYNCSNWEIADMTIDGSNESASTSGGGVAPCKDSTYIHDLKIFNTSYFGIYGSGSINDLIIEKVWFTGFSGGDRIGGGNWNRTTIRDIHFYGNLTQDTNIDILQFDNSIIEGVYQSDDPTSQNLNIYFEPARDSIIRDINTKGAISVIDDSGYLPANYSNPRHVIIENVKSGLITLRGSQVATYFDEFGDFTVRDATINATGGNYHTCILLITNINNSYPDKIIKKFNFENIYCELSSVTTSFNSGYGVHRPAGINTGDSVPLANLYINQIYVKNYNSSNPTYGVEIGQSSFSKNSVKNVSIYNVYGENLTSLINFRNAADVHTNIPRSSISATNVTYAVDYTPGDLNVTGSIFAANLLSNSSINNSIEIIIARQNNASQNDIARNISNAVNANATFLSLVEQNINPNISSMVNANSTFLSLVIQNINPNISSMVNANATFLALLGGTTNVNPNVSAMVNANSTFLAITNTSIDARLNNNGNYSQQSGYIANLTDINRSIGLQVITNATFLSLVVQNMNPNISSMVNANSTFLSLVVQNINPNISAMVNANSTFLSIADQNVNPNISTMVNANSSFLNLFNANPNISSMVNANATFLALMATTSINPNISSMVNTNSSFLNLFNANPNISTMVNANSTFLSLVVQNVNPNISTMVNANTTYLVDANINNDLTIQSSTAMTVKNLTNTSIGGGVQSTGSFNLTTQAVKYSIFINGTALEIRLVS